LIKKAPKTVASEPPYAREDDSGNDAGLTPSIGDADFDKWAADTRFITLDISALSNSVRLPDFAGQMRALMASLEDGASSAKFRTSWKTLFYDTAQRYAWRPPEAPVRRVSLKPVAGPLIRRCTRVIAMVHELHKAGYQRLRMVPMMSPSGAYWRCVITYEENIEDDGYRIIQWDDERVAAYTSGQDAKYFNWDDSQSFNARQLAQRFLERFPDIAERGRGRDWANAGWVVDVLGEAEQGELVFLMADWTIDQAYLDRWRPPAPLRMVSAKNAPSSTENKPCRNSAEKPNLSDLTVVSDLLRKFYSDATTRYLDYQFGEIPSQEAMGPDITEARALAELLNGKGALAKDYFVQSWNSPEQMGAVLKQAYDLTGPPEDSAFIVVMGGLNEVYGAVRYAIEKEYPLADRLWEIDGIIEMYACALTGTPYDNDED
jgi:hypothetical protein